MKQAEHTDAHLLRQSPMGPVHACIEEFKDNRASFTLALLGLELDLDRIFCLGMVTKFKLNELVRKCPVQLHDRLLGLMDQARPFINGAKRLVKGQALVDDDALDELVERLEDIETIIDSAAETPALAATRPDVLQLDKEWKAYEGKKIQAVANWLLDDGPISRTLLRSFTNPVLRSCADITGTEPPEQAVDVGRPASTPSEEKWLDPPLMLKEIRRRMPSPMPDRKYRKWLKDRFQARIKPGSKDWTFRLDLVDRDKRAAFEKILRKNEAEPVRIGPNDTRSDTTTLRAARRS